ncbi:acyltransferase family protein [Mucilaginibacter sp. KACC 22063]|uniref:acyltransferase family protein n=1 Tax=Mucilaginibacter sp. KACC 22063 TaxID=3025666 RepID=UPI0023654DB9|nr:acyltransferase [Mucilaginibacter sp. KACC 22063]WDF53953.1 acyltransferase [Mucilaginibacter sp. KACC 22063]
MLTNHTLVLNFPHNAIKPELHEPAVLEAYKQKGDTLRILAICSVIWSHCLYPSKMFHTPYVPLSFLQTMVIELGRPGTVIFFILSGFCIGKKVHQFSIASYLKYRLQSLIIPWCICLLAYAVLQAFHIKGLQLFHQPVMAIAALITTLLKGLIFHAAYWFVPVAIFSAVVLVAFKKTFNKWWFILILTAITLFYGVNLYGKWIPGIHTKAFAAYILFMWMGVQIRQHILLFHRFIQRIQWPTLLCLIATLLFLNHLEIIQLLKVGSDDPFASIRISNCLLAIVITIAVLKARPLKFVQYLKPQETIFGIYLIHSIIISELRDTFIPLFFRNFHQEIWYTGRFQLLFFIIVVCLSFWTVALVKTLSSKKKIAIGIAADTEIKDQSELAFKG